MKILNYVFLYSVLFSSFNICASDVPVREVATSGLKTIAKNAAAAGPYISLTIQVCSIVKEIKSHNFPNEEERAYANQVAEQYAALTAENELEKCIIKNKDTSHRLSSGLPSECGEVVRLLLMYGGKKEVARMAANYNEYRK